jgi:GYF domain 2
MNWFYSTDAQRMGPISEAQLDELLHSGKISRDPLVWREGMTDWQPLSAACQGAPPPIPGMPGGIACVECGRTFPPGEVIQLNNCWVCAQCKSIFLQRLTEGAGLPAVGLWRKGKQMVTTTNIVFPDRCVKCNAPANSYRLKRQLYWMHPAYYLLLLCNLLILLIVHLIVRKKAVLEIGLCEKHRAQRKMGLAVGWSGALVGIVIIIAGAVIQSGWTVLAGVALFLFGCIYGGIRASTVAITKITKENTVYVRGAKRAFLDTLPKWNGP